MIWFTWRQFRAQFWIAVGLIVAFGAAFVLAQREVMDAYTSSGLAACLTDCDSLVETFAQEVELGLAREIYQLGLAAMYVAPALIGAFWGAPLIARELETGTHRLAWNQSVTRTRWLVTKLLGIGGVAVAATGLLSLGVTWSSSLVDRYAQSWINPLLFGARGVVPLAYAAFAFTLGVALGLVIRRTVPAMAATLAIYVVAVAAMPLWVRAYLAPIHTATPPLDMEKLEGISLSEGNEIRVFGSDPVPGAWVLSNDTISPDGSVFTGPVDPSKCGRSAAPGTCFDWIGSLGLRQDVRYHPAEQFWALQWVEAGLFTALAVLLAGFCVWWVRRRLV
jgi:hypothetical protein